MAGVLAMTTLLSCTKSFDEKTVQQTDFTNSTLVQVYLATLGASRNYVYMDGTKLTGSLMTTGSVFPSTGYAVSVPGGLHSFQVKDTLSSSTQVPLTFAENMQVGQNYTIFMYDTITTPKQLTVPTNIVVPGDTSARIRFAHFAHSTDPVPAVDIFSVKKNANIFTNVQFTEVTDFVPIASRTTDTLIVRLAGSGDNLTNFTSTGTPTTVWAITTPTDKRSYTLIFRGGYNTVVTNKATVRTLSVFANR